MSSPQYLPVFPNKLLMEILSWVPVKDLMRFRCISKWWNSLVFDRTFVKLHLQRSSKNTHVLLTFEDKKKRCAAPCSIQGLLDNPLSTLDDCHPLNHGDTVSVLGVCNGVVCLCGSYRGREFEEYWVRFWNPATRIMSKDLPLLRIRGCKFGFYSFLFGFGYDDYGDTYKVVTVHHYNKSQEIQVRVHCPGDTCWRSTLTCPNGLIEGPPFSPRLEVLKGCLCLSYHRLETTYYAVWLMREFGVEKSWTQLLNVSYEHLQFRCFEHCPPIPLILCMSENFDVLLLANHIGGEIILYNKRDNRMDRYEDIHHSKSLLSSYDYVQSLVLLY